MGHRESAPGFRVYMGARRAGQARGPEILRHAEKRLSRLDAVNYGIIWRDILKLSGVI